MPKKLRDKTSIADFSDRELLEVIFANQVLLHRKVGYVRAILDKGSISALGPYENTVHIMLKEADEILKQGNFYLAQDSEYKSEIPYPPTNPDQDEE
jgi:hypothetical protein